MIDLLYRERSLLTLVVLLIVVAGALSYAALPRLEDPELSQRLPSSSPSFPVPTPNKSKRSSPIELRTH